MIKRILAVLAAVMMVLAMAGCSSFDVQEDQTAVEIDGYHILKTDKKKVECHDAGKAGYGGVGNDMYYYNAGQRTFSFTGNSSEAELDPVPVTTKDNQTIEQPGFMKFTLTTDCDALYDFHKKVGLKYDAYTDDGWKRFLGDYFGVPITTALNDITSDVVTWKEWYNNSALRTEAQTDLVPVLQAAINASLGSNEWIKVNSVSLSRPVPSEALLTGLEAAEKQKLENQAIEQRNVGLLSKYDAMRDCIRKVGLSEEICKIMFLAESGDIPFYPIPQGGDVNVTR